MRCSTCGEFLDPDVSHCPTCGGVPSRVPAGRAPDVIRRCPRCGHRGEGVSYFSRPGHIALLVLFVLITSTLAGLGGLIYWMVKRHHQVCPKCGLDWNALSLKAPVSAPALGDGTARTGGMVGGMSLPRSGIFRRVLGVGTVLGSLVLIGIGATGAGMGAVISGSLIAAGGGMIYWWGWSALQNRRQGLLARLQQQVLQLASRKGGTLTVTEVATELDLSIQVAEKVMMSLDDGFRIRSDITNEGLLLYEFPELKHRSRLDAGHRIGRGQDFPE